jgi:hypothetical protein
LSRSYALAAAKERGVVLGSATLHIARERAIASNQAAANELADKVLPIIRKAQEAGATSLRAIAQVLKTIEGFRHLVAGVGHHAGQEHLRSIDQPW